MEPEEATFDDEELAPRHTWRHIRTAVTLLVLVGFVVGAAWYSWDTVVDSDAAEEADGATASCVAVAPTDAPEPELIELNVYNATQRSGLAREVADEMSERGFIIMDVANDPQQSRVEGSAIVRSHPDQEAAAGLVAAMVPGAEYIPDDRTSETIDLVLGAEFEELAGEPDPEATIDTCA